MQAVRLWKLLAAVMVVALTASLALAQPPGRRGGPGGPGGPMMGPGAGMGFLLFNEQVQKELSLTEQQVQQLREAFQQIRDQMREQFSGLRDLEPEQRREKMRQLGEQLRQQVEQKLKQVLSEEQLTRLRQIELQVAVRTQGIRVLLRDDVAKALGLTDEQRQKVEAAVEKLRAKMREVFESLRDLSPEQRREKMQQAFNEQREESRRLANEILTEEQKAKLKELLGKPVQIEFPRFGPGFRGPRGGEGGPGAGQRGPRGGQRRGSRGQR